ncbi:MAG TPA: hypothetical protein VFY23_13740 [Candidatus Limnocylindrales bacterium]|nr:hypothetical protein [Candidatus Limnocylindrales bacterium]
MRLVALALLAMLLAAACSATEVVERAVAGPPEIVVPPGIRSTQTADQVMARVRAEIATNERRLGRRLQAPRIARVELVREGQLFALPGGGGMSPNDGPGWMVEAYGTFAEWGSGGGVETLATHAFLRYDDAGGGGSMLIPCWSVNAVPPELMEGGC